MHLRALAIPVIVTWACCAIICQAQAQSLERATEKAIAYLARETPKWQTDHHCASCHHQGTAFRALLSAQAAKKFKDDTALATSLEWLDAPQKWKDNHGDPMASDQALAELQFGQSLLRAQRQFPDRYKAPLAELATMIAKRQAADGKFELESGEGLPSPITLGPILLTAIARDILATQGEAHQEPRKRADDWLRQFKARNTFEAASQMIALQADKPSEPARQRALKLLLDSAHDKGGFGPYASAPAEVFDSALAIIALSRDPNRRAHQAIIDKSKQRLIDWQGPDGDWEETTRPSGGVSYAHRISTTSWALEALLEK
jgi:hypothetical protein